MTLTPPKKQNKQTNKNKEDEPSAKWSALRRGHVAALLILKANWLAAPALLLPQGNKRPAP